MAKNSKSSRKASDGPCQILKCPGCRPHGFQDTRYGDKMRVHNPGATELHCTVCGNRVSYSSSKSDAPAAAKPDAKAAKGSK